MSQFNISPDEVAKLEEKFEIKSNERKLKNLLKTLTFIALVAMSIYHFYASGFGTIRDILHRGIHISFVVGLVFLFYGWKNFGDQQLKNKVPLIDIFFSILVVVTALYLPLLPPEILASRVGNPSSTEVIMGSILIILTLEAARRSIGYTLPLICIIFMIFALYGPFFPGALKHGGSSWAGFVNHIYITNQGIYGIAVGVMAQYVFLFILFGVLATRIGLGQLFIDLAMVIAGRYSGGPAKVAIFSSAFLGTISGSSIANTVTTGSLTIPAMKKVGYPPHFSGAVEATASTGGQITPPILGAAAFIMVEYLELPLRDILAAALIPALLHYFGIFVMVHLEAKKLGLRGLNESEVPKFIRIIRDNWLAIVPLFLLVYLILIGRTPDYAAVNGIIACVVIGFIRKKNRLTFNDLFECLARGAKNTLAVGAAATSIGIIVGVVTLTGVGFRLGYVVIQTAGDIGGFFLNFLPFNYFTLQDLTLFFSLILIAISCIFMGTGVPTTATYIILVAVAAPALTQLQIEPIVSHFFVFYYGVLADITPPVALAAYAAAGIAGSNPFTTGNTAFRLGIAKALVPFVFVYSPSLLLVAQGFNFYDFFITLISAMIGIGLIGIGFTGYLYKSVSTFQRWYLGIISLLFIAPGLSSSIIGLVLVLPVFVLQLRK
ncbi:TRAP transporter permease [Candidatus Pelagibacter sp.]|nr:TRAP transporter permease [Candidatus Pelagibacter sp.]